MKGNTPLLAEEHLCLEVTLEFICDCYLHIQYAIGLQKVMGNEGKKVSGNQIFNKVMKTYL